ncbi:MAG: hypothetical protein NT154_04980, partial [Verrucomicrobia bacterium]|nr:hypothetical protein [Verrucomicrobiota bacterium]
MTRAFIFLFLATASFAAQEKHAVLLDRSGSMKSYYDIQVIQDSARAIQEVLQTHGNVDLFGFSTEVKGARNLADIGQLPFGQSTYLDRALDYAITRQYAIVWMITDNVQDQPGAAEAGNTEIFYRRLRSNAVKRVVIFPLLQAPGRAGLVIYALLLGDSDQEYEKEIAEFVRHANGLLMTEPLRMKPLDRDTIEVRLVRSTQAQPGRKRVAYDAGQPISEQMEIRFKSKFEHLEIADAKIEVLKASPGFQKGSLLSSDKREIAITPDKITIGAGDETQQIYRVSIDLGVVRLRRGLSTL